VEVDSGSVGGSSNTIDVVAINMQLNENTNNILNINNLATSTALSFNTLSTSTASILGYMQGHQAGGSFVGKTLRGYNYYRLL
jgi:hypothetical protein